VTPSDTPHTHDGEARDSDQALGCAAFVAGLADAGLTTVFISPGSRNTPLTVAFARSGAIRDISIRDERSGGFMALGFAKATGVPAAVLCTSGSAATHYFPAVVEADQSNTPLIVLTADRPVSLRGTHAPQTMDQTNLFGSHVKAWIDLDIRHDQVRNSAVAAVRTASGGIPGAVHINVPLAEPLVPVVMPDPPAPDPIAATDGSHPGGVLDLSHLDGQRVLVVAGGAYGSAYTAALGLFSSSVGAPLLADPQCRPEGDTTIANADLLATAGALDRLAPDHIVRLGPIPTSKAIWTWLETCGIDQTLIQRSRLGDPLGSATTTIDINPVDALGTVTVAKADPSYLGKWLAVDEVAGKSVETALAEAELTEPRIARTVTASVVSGSTLFVGSSMPIRDVDAFAAPRSDIRIIGNRGLNGIDGSISTALGMALSGTPTTALIGDVAALHDVTALAEAARLGAPLTIVVINNDGGGIFSLLPQRSSSAIDAETYEHHWGTPHGLSLSTIAQAFGVSGTRVSSGTDLANVFSQPGPVLVEVLTDRTANAAFHADIRASVTAAVGAI
jgi:2-succinyl-5-enolpyruvyl-6-hydroxy-3-cyclohexene-1-carboxylate synthase